MAKQVNQRSAELKSGIFIIVALALLMLSVLWLRYFSIRPEMTISAKFKDPGPVSRGLQVYYHGVNIGKVAKADFTKDYKNTLVYLQIFREDLKLPSNVYADIRTEGITGQKYVNISYPDNPSSELLADNDIIYGKSPFSLEDFQDFLQNQMKSGRMERIFSNLDQTLANSSKTSKDLGTMTTTINNLIQSNKKQIDSFFKYGSLAASDISQAAAVVNAFVQDPATRGDLKTTINTAADAAESFSKLTAGINGLMNDSNLIDGLKTSVGGLSRLLGKAENAVQGLETGAAIPLEAKGTLGNLGDLLVGLNTFISNMNCYTGQIYKDIQDTSLIENASATFAKASTTLDKAENIFGKTEKIVDKIDKTQFNGTMAPLIIDTVQSTNQAAKRVDCLSKGLSDMLSKRFLLIRLLFGKPGASLEDCTNLENSMKAQIKPAKKEAEKVTPCPAP